MMIEVLTSRTMKSARRAERMGDKCTQNFSQKTEREETTQRT